MTDPHGTRCGFQADGPGTGDVPHPRRPIASELSAGGSFARRCVTKSAGGLLAAVVPSLVALYGADIARARPPALASLAAQAATTRAPASTTYRLTRSYRVGGDGGWDYLTGPK